MTLSGLKTIVLTQCVLLDWKASVSGTKVQLVVIVIAQHLQGIVVGMYPVDRSLLDPAEKLKLQMNVSCQFVRLDPFVGGTRISLEMVRITFLFSFSDTVF